MTLDEAIIHAEEVADRCDVTDGDSKCSVEHRQLAEWLKELKTLRKQDVHDNNVGKLDCRQEALDDLR